MNSLVCRTRGRQPVRGWTRRLAVLCGLVAASALLTTAGPSYSATLHVPSVYPTIQAAVNMAFPGDTILVAPGYYYASFVVPSNKGGLTIRGDLPGWSYSYYGAYIYAPNTTIERLVLVSGTYGAYVGPGASCTMTNVWCYYQQYGVYASNSTLTLNGCYCLQNTGFGVGVYGPSGSLTMTGGGVSQATNRNGVLLYGGAQGTVNGTDSNYNAYGFSAQSGASVTVTNCTARYNAYDGVLVYDASATATNCTLTNNSVNGCRCWGPTSQLTVTGGSLSANTAFGAYYHGGAGGAISNAEVAFNSRGITLYGSSAHVTGNSIHDNSLYGIDVTPFPGSYFHGGSLALDPAWAAEDFVSAPTISGNTLWANGSCGIWCMDARPTNVTTLDTDNTFPGSPPGLMVGVRWYGGIQAMWAGDPVPGAQVALSAVGYGPARYTADAQGFVPAGADPNDAFTWLSMGHYMAYNGVRYELNPWQISATANGGNLRGSCSYSWDGEHKSEGSDIDGRYQIAYVELNARPLADAGEDRTVEANTVGGADVTLDAAGCSDADGDELTFTWKEGGTILAGPTTDVQSEVYLALGEHPITLIVDDGQDDPVSDACVITVVDTTAPSFCLDVLARTLWPPDRRMVKAAEVHSLADICDPNPSMAITVSCSEPADAPGDPGTEADWQIVQTGTVWEIWLRAERAGTSVPRKYCLECVAMDASGNANTQTATITVPRDMS